MIEFVASAGPVTWVFWGVLFSLWIPAVWYSRAYKSALSTMGSWEDVFDGKPKVQDLQRVFEEERSVEDLHKLFGGEVSLEDLQKVFDGKLSVAGLQKRFHGKCTAEDLQADRSSLKTLGTLGEVFLSVRFSARTGDLASLDLTQAAPLRAGEILGPEFFLPGNRNYVIAEALPGIFAGVGILGTFLGITIGLGALGGDANDPTVLLGQVQGLIGGMVTAFSTSVLGIAFSLTWLLSLRHLQGELSTRLGLLTEAIDEVLPVLVPEKALLDLKDLNAEAKTSLQNLAEDLAEALEGKFEAALETFGEGLRRNDQSGIEEMASAFHQKLESSMGAQLTEVGEAITKATEYQEKVGTHIESFSARLEKVSSRQTELLEATTAAAVQFNASVEGLSQALHDIEGAAAHAKSLAEASVELAAAATAEAHEYREASKELSAAMAEQLDSLDEHLSNLREAGVTLKDAVIGFTSLSEQRIEAVFRAFDKEMAGVVDHLGGTLVEIRDATNELPSLQRAANETIDRIEPAAAALGETLPRLAELLESVTIGPLIASVDELRAAISEGSSSDPMPAPREEAGADGVQPDDHRSSTDAQST